MAILLPFKALRPSPSLVEQVACPPYDVVNLEDVKSLIKGNPYSLLHLTRSEADFKEKINPYDFIIYEKAKKNLNRFLSEKILVQDTAPCLYIYRQQMGDHSQTGLVGCTSVEEYDSGIIKRHENTRKDKEEDRTRHIDHLNAQLEPIFLTYKPFAEIDAIVAQEMDNSSPIYDFICQEQVHHQLWIISEEKTILKLVELFSSIPHLYIADGHHRAASAAAVSRKRKKDCPSHTGKEPYHFILSVLFPADQVKILPYNRLVKDINGLTPEQFISRLENIFHISSPEKDSAFQPETPRTFGLYLNQCWYKLTAKAKKLKKQEVVESLDVSFLQNNVLAPLLGIHDPRTNERIDFAGGMLGIEKIIKKVNSGDMKAGFTLFPVSVETLMEVADENKLMPPKSTWFEPKLKSGLFIHPLEN
ncbi:MAG: DUF1015 domain-containing protein [Candidatus Aureabacteria bacterium]|nr:DUF1015 domain-containing protein [Candidatus Auribacterota bacterium]